MRRNYYYLLTLLLSLAFATSCTKQNPISDDQQISAFKGVISQEYPLTSVSDPDISGVVTFQKIGDKTKVTIILDGTEVGNMHPAHIHFNSVAMGGGIAVSLTPVNGASGRSTTIVSEMDNGTPITYEDLLNFNGHVNVHLSMTQLSVLIAQGDIGSNF